MKKIAMVVCAFSMFVGTVSASEKELVSASSRSWKSAVGETACGGLGILAAYKACDHGGVAPVALCAASAAVLGNSMTAKEALACTAFGGTIGFVLPRLLGMSYSEDDSIEVLTVMLAGTAGATLAKKGIAAAREFRDKCMREAAQSDRAEYLEEEDNLGRRS